MVGERVTLEEMRACADGMSNVELARMMGAEAEASMRADKERKVPGRHAPHAITGLVACEAFPGGRAVTARELGDELGTFGGHWLTGPLRRLLNAGLVERVDASPPRWQLTRDGFALADAALAEALAYDYAEDDAAVAADVAQAWLDEATGPEGALLTELKRAFQLERRSDVVALLDTSEEETPSFVVDPDRIDELVDLAIADPIQIEQD